MTSNKFKFDYLSDSKKNISKSNKEKKSVSFRCDDSTLFNDKKLKEPRMKPINYKTVNEIFDEKDKKQKCPPKNKQKNDKVKTYNKVTKKDNKLEKCDESKPMKFFDNSSRDYCSIKYDSSNRIEDESFLLLPRINSKQKTKVELKDAMHPNDYRVDLASDNIRKTKQYTSYYGDHYGPGKGFGNTTVSNEIRNGVPTRNENNVFNERIESEINGPRDIIFKNYQDPNHIILPFPRGGEITRKSVQNNNRNLTEDAFSEFKFKY